MDNTLITSRWYRSWWGIMLLGAAGLVLVIAIAFGGLTFYYLRQIKQGSGDILSQQFNKNVAAATAIDRAALEIADAPFTGSVKAPVTIVEFIDFKCSNCKAAAPVVEKVAQKYGAKARIIIRNFPVESTHPGSTQFSKVAYCADRQGRFWAVHDLLYAEQSTLPAVLPADQLQSLSDRVELDFAKLQACLNSDAANIAVNRDYADALKFGVTGTPTFFVNGEKVEGVAPFETWQKYFENVK